MDINAKAGLDQFTQQRTTNSYYSSPSPSPSPCLGAHKVEATNYIDSTFKSTDKERHISDRDAVNLESSIDILGQNFPIIVLPENTPLLYQWFHKNEESSMPVYFFENLINTCKIETERKIGILVLERRANKKDIILLKDLEKRFKNFCVIDFDGIDVSEFNYSVSKKQLIQRFDVNFEFNLKEYPDFYKTIYNGHEEEFKILDVMEFYSFFNFFDAARNFAMLHAGALFSDQDKDAPTGCIYLDLDMFLTGKIGSIKCVDGFSCILKKEASLNIDNSLFCVNKSKHPILLKWLKDMKECRRIGNVSIAPIPYWRFCGAIQQHYIPKKVLDRDKEDMELLILYLSEQDCSLVPEIAFPLNNIDPDQSNTKGFGTSWGKTMRVVF